MPHRVPDDMMSNSIRGTSTLRRMGENVFHMSLNISLWCSGWTKYKAFSPGNAVAECKRLTCQPFMSPAVKDAINRRANTYAA